MQKKKKKVRPLSISYSLYKKLAQNGDLDITYQTLKI